MYLTRLGNVLLKPSVQSRFSSNLTTNNEIAPILTNRNPRNLEKLRIAYKPDGYHVDRKGRSFWHKLKLTASSRQVTASVVHFENGEVLKVSTQEWALHKQLYRNTDASAYMNLARVFAQRCLQSGIIEMYSDLKPDNENNKLALFIKTLEENGVSLNEPPQFKKAQPWDLERPEAPWNVE